MNHIYLCPRHYKNLGNQIETKDGDCKFCLGEIYWWFCTECGFHWEGQAKCPKCGERFEIKKTLNPEEAEERGLK